MAITLGDVIDQVREAHPAFDPRIVTVQGFGRMLTRYQRRLSYVIAQIVPDVLLQVVNVPYTDALLIGAAGYALPSYITLRGGTVHFTGDLGTLGELTLVKEQDRLGEYGRYPAFIMGQVLFLVGAPTDWQGVASIDVAHIPMPADLVDNGSTFTLPDGALDALVARACLFAARRVGARPDVPNVNVAEFAVEADRAETAFLTGLSTLHQSTIHYTREAF